MTLSPRHTHLADTLTSRRGARISLAIAVLSFIALFGLLSSAQKPQGRQAAPSDSESAQVTDLLQQFPHADRQSVLLVAQRDDHAALTSSDLAGLQQLRPTIEKVTGHDASAPRVSGDGEAALVTAPITVGKSDSDTADTIDALRSAIGAHQPADLEVYVTGGPAFGADVASSFNGANFTLLAVTVLIVAVLLIITYRSPVLWLIPLAVIALADQLSNVVTTAVAAALGLHFDSGIVSVLVFGAGTDYALLLMSRYREQLAEHENHRTALAAAWRSTVPAILASNVTVVLSLLTLTLAVIPGTRGLGVASAVGLVIALAAVLLALPPALAMCGRKVFWPFTPKPGVAHRSGRVWHAISRRVMRRPAVSLVSALIVLGIMTMGLLGTSLGLTQLQQFRVQSDSAAGLEVVSAHFPPGEAQPILVVADSSRANAVTQAIDGVPGVVRTQPINVTADGRLTEIMVTSSYAPGTEKSLQLVRELRSSTHAVDGAHALVGGQTATQVDARAGNHRDLLVIAPLILAVSFIILLLLLRSVLAPILLLAVNLLSATAAIGLGSWLSRLVFDQGALASQLPLLAFLFLVALGIDYTIFLVHRAKSEAASHGTRQGMVRAVTHTGSVITSAGIVLAGVFAALGILPLVILGQLGIVVGVGVLVDTLIVRTVVVPSLFGVLGDRAWWPSRPGGRGNEHHDAESGYDDQALARAR